VIDHLSLGTAELARAAAFYDAVLAPLGVVRVWSFPDAVGYGVPGGGDQLALKARAGATAPGAGFHLAFTAGSHDAVDAAWRAGVAGGGRDDGPPGLRERYGPGYYAAFLVDPDGHRLEVVCHDKAASAAS